MINSVRHFGIDVTIIYIREHKMFTRGGGEFYPATLNRFYVRV